MGPFDPEPRDKRVADVDDDTGGYESDGPLSSGITLTSSALSTDERAAIDLRPSNMHEHQEQKSVSAHLKSQGPGAKLDHTVLHSFGKEGVQETLCCRMTDDGHMVAVGARDGRVRLVSMQPGGGLMHTLGDEFPASSAPSCTALRWRPESWSQSETRNVLFAARGHEILQYHATSGRVMRIFSEPDNQVYALATCIDKPMFASAGSDRNLRLYDPSSQHPPVLLKSGGSGSLSIHTADSVSTGHSNSIYALAWIPGEPDILLSGGWDNTVHVWDCRAGASVRSIFGPYICGDALDIKNGQILTGSWRNQDPLQLWDYSSGKLMTNLPLHQPQPDACFLYSAQFGKADRGNVILAGGSGLDPALHVLKSTGEMIGTCPAISSVHSIDSATRPDGSFHVAVCCAGELLHLKLP